MLCFIYFQQTFQVVLATDGISSFAIFNYANPNQVVDITSGSGVIGFDAGDLIRGITLPSSEGSNFTLGNVNIFRIDGNDCV